MDSVNRQGQAAAQAQVDEALENDRRARATETMTQARAAYNGSDGEAYMIGRGIPTTFAERYGIGYNAKDRRVIIPLAAPYSYGGRAIDNVAQPEPKFKVNWGGKRGLYPAAWPDMIAHDNDDDFPPEPVFIVEGEIDALSIMIATGYDGGNIGNGAIALGGTSGVNRAVNSIVDIRDSGAKLRPFILIPDIDEPTATAPEGAGMKAMCDLAKQFTERGVEYCFYADEGAQGRLDVLRDMDVKDANAALVKDRDKFTRALIDAAGDAHDEIKRKRDTTRNAYLAKTAGSASSMADFDKYLKDRESRKTITTGIDELDKLLGGGLDERLYIVAAASSFGKTSFCLQMAEHISATGTDVMFFAFEMGRHELTAKGISRRTFLNAMRTNDDGTVIFDTYKAATLQDILDSAKNPPDEHKKAAIKQARADYQLDAANLYLTEAGVDTDSDRPTAEFIGAAIEQHITDTGRRPVVFIDYLQLLEPTDDRHTTKQNMDNTSTLLRQLVRGYKIPIITISSISRPFYYKPIEKESLKESGNLEFSADVIIGIQARGLLLKNAQSSSKDEERVGKEAVQEATDDAVNAAEIVIPKNRGGLTSGVKRSKAPDGTATIETRNVLNIEFYKKYSHFTAAPEQGQTLTKKPKP